MNALTQHALRVCEWEKTSRHKLTAQQRKEIYATVNRWSAENNFQGSPLSFSGHDGSQLCTRQFVGVVQCADVLIEIYPKLDAELVKDPATLDSSKVASVMQSLVWMMEVSRFLNLNETDSAPLEEVPENFLDLFAYLMARNLSRELELGLPHVYQAHEDDLKMVRGRILISRQLTHNWNRLDRVACRWDEFTPNTPMNRLLKAACRFFSRRVTHATTHQLLLRCIAVFDEVDDVDTRTALDGVRNLIWTRSTERFRTSFELAKRLLQGTGHNLSVGDASTFVFLIDMNKLFEQFAHAVLEAKFSVRIERKKFLGTLFNQPSGGIQQYADYYWRHSESAWIGDAKYKRLFKDGLAKVAEIEDVVSDENRFGDMVLNANDVRQLTVYAELERNRSKVEKRANLLLLYPFVGEEFQVDSAKAWNGSPFLMVPVKVKQRDNLADALPPLQFA